MTTTRSEPISCSLVGVVRSARNQSFPLWKALLELVDNSVDASASRVDIAEVGSHLAIEDNGAGFDNVVAALNIGESDKAEGIGRYGVGLKHSSIKFSDTTVIESRGLRATIPWTDILGGRDPGNVSVEDCADDGVTRITLQGFKNRYKSALDSEHLAKAYSPLLADGKLSISINGKKLAPLALPRFLEGTEIAKEFAYRGKHVNLAGGIFAHNDPARKNWVGYHLYYRGRLIGPGKIVNMGVGDSVCTNWCFVVTLTDGAKSAWSLATNKDDVEDAEHLLNYIYDEYARALMELAAEESERIELKEFIADINKHLNEEDEKDELIKRGQQHRRKKDNPDKPGTVDPNGEGASKQNTYTDMDDDNPDYDAAAKSRKKRNRAKVGLHFDMRHLGNGRLLEVQDQGKRVIITMNLDNPWVATHGKERWAFIGIAKLAYCILCQTKGKDTAPDEIIQRIMEQAGKELA